ncbi:MAG: aspartate aminotransferase family protein, partial [Myxococcota bacterium]
MTNNQTLAAHAKDVFVPNYRPAPVVLDRGEGAYVFDIEGRRYLDMVAGIAVSALGHGHSKLTKALQAQSGRLLHTSNLYLNQPAIDLADRLVAHSFAERIFFCNSGAEANEACIKTARRFAFARGDAERNRIVTFTHSFHGRTYGALTATAQPKYHEGFGPMPEGFDYIEYGDADALRRAVSAKTAAILLEPIQGEGGVNLPPSGFLSTCRQLADDSGALLIFDEVQAGVGRTGKMFAHQHESVAPDLMAVAKGVGGGLPLGAMAATARVAEVMQPGTHGTTYGGSPLACIAGTVVMDEVAQPGFMDNVVRQGQALMDGLDAVNRRCSVFSKIRGRGLMIGAQLSDQAAFDAKDVVAECRKEGVLVHVAGQRVLRLLPPLIIEAE